MPTTQAPLPSGFTHKTTAAEVAKGHDLRGKVVIHTGGYSGLGLETTRVLAKAGATLIVPARTPEKARAALKDIPNVEQERLDLADPKSIDAFAERFLKSDRPLPLLINGAGIMGCPLARDSRGYESQFAVNHLGHFQLTLRLLPALKKANGARVVALSSRAHRMGAVNFDDINFERHEYDKWKSYGQAKSANALFAVELDRRGQAHGIRAFSLHPGRILTELSRFLSPKELQGLAGLDESGNPLANALPLKTIPEGAATTVWCALSSQLDGKGGVYCEDCDIAQAVPGEPSLDYGVRPWAMDPALAEKLWSLSETMTKTKWEL